MSLGIKIIVETAADANAPRAAETETRIYIKPDGEFEQVKAFVKISETVLTPGVNPEQARKHINAIMKAQEIADVLDAHWKEIVEIIQKTPPVPF